MTTRKKYPGNGKLTPELEEIRALRAQVRRLQMEKDTLKKATVDSSDQRNTPFNDVRWRLKFQRLSRSLI